MTQQAIARVGSDASFDLIMEAYPLDMQQQCLLLSESDEFVAQAESLMEHFKLATKQLNNFSLRVNLFQRFPDEWVWHARFKALVEKLRAKQKGELLPWL